MAKIAHVSRDLNSLISGIIGGKTSPVAFASAGVAAGKLTSEDVNFVNTSSFVSGLYSGINGITSMAGKTLPIVNRVSIVNALVQIGDDIVNNDGKIKDTSLSNLASAITGIGGGAVLATAGPAALAVGVGLLSISAALGSPRWRLMIQPAYPMRWRNYLSRWSI